MPSNYDKDILSNWLRLNHGTVESVKNIRINERTPVWYPSMYSPQYGPAATDFSEMVMVSNSKTVQAATVTVPVDSLLQLVRDAERLDQLMRIREVREAVMYYTLNGYLEN